MANKERHFFEFGPFRIDPDHRLLLRENQPLPLQSKAFDVLLTLVQNSERVVSKDDLLKTVWPETFVEESNLAQHVFVLRKILGDTAGGSRYIVTVPGRGYRFAEKVQVIGEEEEQLVVESHSRARLVIEEESVAAMGPARALPSDLTASTTVSKRGQMRWNWILGAIVLLVMTGVVIRYERKPPPLKEADLVLVSDFVNTTGEPIFDGTLKHALTVKLSESPYFNVVPDTRTGEILRLMGKSAAERVVLPTAREICQREGAKVLVGGSVVRLGDKYVVDLDAMDCLTGHSVAHQETEAPNKEQVLSKLSQVIPPLRKGLGESLSSIQKFDTPIEQATTRSLAALKAYTSGDETRAQGRVEESIPSYKMAIELDPDFAMAYARLAAVYISLDQSVVSDEYMRKAFERREHVSEPEKFYIQAHYYSQVTGETDKAIETYKLWTEVYPRDWNPFANLRVQYSITGRPELAIESGQKALQLNPSNSLSYGGLAVAYQFASSFAEAKAICDKAKAQKLDGWFTHRVLFNVGLISGDEIAMQRELNWAKGSTLEGWLLDNQANVTMSLGQVQRSRGLFEEARRLTLKQGLNEGNNLLDSSTVNLLHFGHGEQGHDRP